MSGIILLHAGAGYHSIAKERLYAELCDAACRKGKEILQDGGSASSAIVEAMKVLEDSPLTNAGYGSSLTADGTVECDASLMTSDGYFGSVAAVQAVSHPIDVALKLLQHQHQPPADGRIPPSCLAGEGALCFAREHEIAVVDPSALVSGAAKSSYEKYLKIVEKHRPEKRPGDALTKAEDQPDRKASLLSPDDERALDTVGGICIDSSGSIACALSSGGIALKHPGRVGQAAMIGCGCWVDEHVAVATTGCGEQLMRTMLAKVLADKLQSSSSESDEEPSLCRLELAMKEMFIDSHTLSKDKDKLAGAIVIQLDGSKCNAELLWTHTTRSMCISYMSTRSDKPTVLISRLQADQVSQTSACSGVTVSLRGDS